VVVGEDAEKEKMKLFNKNLFLGTLAGIVIIEALSLAAYHFDSLVLQILGFAIVFLGVIILSFRNLEYGVLIAFVELFISSFGHLFKIETEGFRMTMRVGIFFAVQIAYNTMLITHLLRNKIGGRFLTRLHAFFQTGLRDSHILTSFFKGPYFYANWAIFGALVNGNELKNMFHDADAYVTFAYFPIIWAAFSSQESRLKLYNVFLASLTWLGVQTAVILYLFAHRFQGPMQAIYLWVRDARIGEITLVAGDFYRIFFQSYIYALLAIFILAVFLIGKKSSRYTLNAAAHHYVFLLFTTATFLLLMSFSRSFWFGGAVGVIALLVTLRPLKIVGKDFWHALLKMGGGVLLALALIFAIVNVPLPAKKGPPISLADLFGGRATTLFGEAAATSRWNLLPVLWGEIKQNPVLGAGFGKTVTYITTDPRIVAEDPTGTRTTYAFEWGYLDLWLKLGVPGLLAYGWLVWIILKSGWRKLRTECTPITYGVWLGVIALLAAHFFTPYLNHPLGIGILIFAASVFQSEQKLSS
jgi:hypothetical protein